VAVLAVALLALMPRLIRPRVPQPDLSEASPGVRRAIERHIEEVRRHRRSATAWGELGSVLYAYRLMAPARQALEQASLRDPRNPRWPYLHGLSLLVEDPRTAAFWIQRTVEICGNHPPAPRLRLAYLMAEEGRWPEVEGELEKLRQDHPDQPHALLLAARAAQHRADLARAEELARRARAAPEVARPALALLATLLTRRGDLDGARAAAAQAADAPGSELFSDPFHAEAQALRDDPESLSVLVHPLLARGELEAAGRVTARMKKDYPGYADTWLAAGRLELLRTNPAAAEQHLRRHLELSPGSVQGWFQLGLCLLAQRRNPDAAGAFAKAIEFKPDLAAAWHNRGLALGRIGERSAAIAAFQQVLRYSPEHLEAYLLYADLCLQSGDKPGAITLLDTAAQLRPGDRRIEILRRKAAALP
jgi:tetratricopeptide (TPR) repeat protein